MDIPLSLKSRAAPEYKVPPNKVVCVEHPFIIQNVSKAIETLGGHSRLEKLIRAENIEQGAALFLRPHDRMSTSICSGNERTNNVLLKISVPKRIKRRTRSRLEQAGQDGAKECERRRSKVDLSLMEAPRDAEYLLQSLRDNAKTYKVDVVGTVENTHRFRAMPDFVYSTTNSTFVNKIREHILSFDYDKSKGFSLDLGKGTTPNSDLIPPPNFSNLVVPFNYSYLQNPSIRHVLDSSGSITTFNTQQPRKNFTYRVPFDIATVPTGPGSKVLPVESLDANMRRLIIQIEQCLHERPIWTRRALTNKIRTYEWNNIGQHIIQYVGYMFRSGPWREAVIKYGVDPRTNPKYRFYQTLHFRLDMEFTARKQHGNVEGKAKKSPLNLDGLGHMFDGKNVQQEAKVWQVCDVTDPILKSILDTTDFRRECHLRSDGWYHNGTWAKARTIMKAKIRHMMSGKGIPQDSDYAQIASMPDVLNDDDRSKFILNRDIAEGEQIEWAASVRAAASSPDRERTDVNLTTSATEELGRETRIDKADISHRPIPGENSKIADPRAVGAMSEFNRKHLESQVWDDDENEDEIDDSGDFEDVSEDSDADEEMEAE